MRDFGILFVLGFVLGLFLLLREKLVQDPAQGGWKQQM